MIEFLNKFLGTENTFIHEFEPVKTGFKILVRSRDKEREKILYPFHEVLGASFLDHCVAYMQGFQNILGLYMIWKGSEVKNRNGRQKNAKKRLFFMTIFSVTLPKLG